MNDVVVLYGLTWAFGLMMWWSLFHKAGKPSWYALVPILNVVAIIHLAGRPWWWFLLLLIPGVNLIVVMLLYLDIARAFGRGRGFGLGLFFLTPLFGLILALGDAEYVLPPSVEYRPKLSLVLWLSLLAVVMVAGFFLTNWLTPPFRPAAAESRFDLTAWEIVRGTDEAKQLLSTSDVGLPLFHRLLVLVPVLAGVLVIVVWLHLLKLLPDDATLTGLLALTGLLFIWPYLWQWATSTYQRYQLLTQDSSPPAYIIERSVFQFSAWYTTGLQEVLGALALAVVLGEYAVFRYDRRHGPPASRAAGR